MSVVSSVHRHPLCKVSPVVVWQIAGRLTDVEFVSNQVRNTLTPRTIKNERTHPIKSIVLIIKPSVGLTVVTSSFMIRLTMVVLPALSRPLVPPPLAAHLDLDWEFVQHQYSHLLVLQTGFS